MQHVASIKMPSNLAGRLKNTLLPITSGLMPLLEAVVNSIHSIEETPGTTIRGKINIEIQRKKAQDIFNFESTPKKRGPEAKGDILGFVITDTGIGFTDANMASFNTLDSEHKAAKGCRGIGRLLWLKAFEAVSVRSAYKDTDSKLKLRSFEFNKSKGVNNLAVEDYTEGDETFTAITLNGFDKRYRDATRKTAQAIADILFEHCLWYFVRSGGAPEILIYDDGEVTDLDDVYRSHMHASSIDEQITINGCKVDLLHVRLRSNALQAHSFAFCANNRLVKEENISGKIPGLYGRLRDDAGDFIYSCYVTGSYFDEHVRPERTDFDISDRIQEALVEGELDWVTIRDAIIKRSEASLSTALSSNKERAKQKVDAFVSIKAPRYRPILGRIPENELNIDPDLSDKELELTLHKQYAAFENQLLADGHDLLNPVNTDSAETYLKKLTEYLAKASDLKKSDLANYVCHRRVIIDLLANAILRTPDGKYSREDMIHQLIMPMRKSSNQVLLDGVNLWLVDERLAFHHYLASDLPLSTMGITDSASGKEPDILSIRTYDNPLLFSESRGAPLASIVVVEIKRPMRNDMKAGEEKDPIEQALKYVQRTRDGGVKTVDGRPIPRSADVPGFCYIIADLTETMIERCRHNNLKPTHDHMGYFGYHDYYKTYIEVISFDRLVQIARERNASFFDKLGLPLA